MHTALLYRNTDIVNFNRTFETLTQHFLIRGGIFLTVSSKMKMRELVKPPRIVYNSEDANFPLYTSCKESVVMNRRKEYSIELPGPAMDFRCTKEKNNQTDELFEGNTSKEKKEVRVAVL